MPDPILKPQYTSVSALFPWLASRSMDGPPVGGGWLVRRADHEDWGISTLEGAPSPVPLGRGFCLDLAKGRSNDNWSAQPNAGLPQGFHPEP